MSSTAESAHQGLAAVHGDGDGCRLPGTVPVRGHGADRVSEDVVIPFPSTLATTCAHLSICYV